MSPCAANSSNMNMDTSYPCSCRCSFQCQGDLTRHRQFCDVAQHQSHREAAYTFDCQLEELSAGKEIIHDIPTTALLVPLDFLLVNIQGIVPQDTAIIDPVDGRLQGDKVCACVCAQCVSAGQWLYTNG